MPVTVESLRIPDVKLLYVPCFGDERGFFSETYSKRDLEAAGISLDFVQDNHVLSRKAGTVRGLHFQTPPCAQDKLVRVARGAIFDVAVDLRKGSPTYGTYVTVELSSEKWNQILIPIGFAHGLVTLVPDTEVIYKVTNYYAPEHDTGIAWDDPDLGIPWPVARAEALVSAKDRKLPRLRECLRYF